MINQYPLWKYLLLIAVIVAGGLYALPNLYGEDPAIQISHRSEDVTQETLDQVEDVLKEHNIPIKRSEFVQGTLLVRFANEELQLAAADLIKSRLSRQHIVAFNLAPSTPGWLQALGANPMYLGLDLRGGVHFLMEVGMQAAITRLEESLVSEIRTFLREEKIRYLGASRDNTGITVRFGDAQLAEEARSVLRREFDDLDFRTIEQEGNVRLVATLTETAVREEKRSAVQQNITTLRNRVNELGVAEPLIQQQGESRIVVQLPGVQDTTRAKEILGATATLEFRLTEGDRAEWFEAETSGRVPLNARLYHMRDDGSPVLLKRQVIVTGDQINDASSTIDQQSGSPAVSVRLDGKGAKRMGETTRQNINKPMAVVFIENKVETQIVDGEPVKIRKRVEEVINVATIRDAFSRNFQITGLDSQEAHNLALLLRAGALRAPVEIVEERTIGPSLGQDNIDQGFNSVMIGFALVMLFMALYYKVFGLVANLALTANLILIIAILSMIQATLTLPGIAGIVLTVGMAVDANVLIFERIREELRNGNSPQASIHAGYSKAFSTIMDANITTLLAAVVLFIFGTGPIKGFAITLSIGILMSMFTAILGTRALINLIYGGRTVSKLPI